MSDDASRRRLRCRVIYRGRVQGVGFRYTSASIARRFPVTGYVRNLPDGTVGEIYICWTKLTEGARARKVSRRAYLLRLVVHGLCHIMGYRHDDERSERKMEKAEIKHLSKVLAGSEIERLFE